MLTDDETHALLVLEGGLAADAYELAEVMSVPISEAAALGVGAPGEGASCRNDQDRRRDRETGPRGRSTARTDG
jgi:hypothetical protein